MSVGYLNVSDLVRRLATRVAGRSEATVQADVRTLLLTHYFHLQEDDVVQIVLESPAGQRRRIDIEAGFTVIEVKRDLRVGSVREDAIEQLAGYVRQRAETLGQRYVGILTDGAEWSLYHLTPAGTLQEVSTHSVSAADPDVDSLVVWLEGVLATREQVVPTPQEIERRLGATSPSHRLDVADLTSLYELNRETPGVKVKRELWAKLLTTAFGSSFTNDDGLFIEHTLLVMTADVIAHAVVGFEPAALAPATILSGRLFDQAQITGVVEEDFFDWLLEVEGGEPFIRTLARRLSRFAWGAAEHDVMKVLYESVIDPEQRHSLGEYYTPDWLASVMIGRVVEDSLHQRVLDPACGSGTFLFHAVRRYLAAAEEAGISPVEALDGVSDHVIGVDVHPLAVTFARVTYLLALGLERIQSTDRGPINVPVYLGDSLQWSQSETIFTAGTLTVPTGEGVQLFANELRFPEGLLGDTGQFDGLVAELADRATDRPPGSPTPDLTATFRRFVVSPGDQQMVSETFQLMCDLHDQGRDHIWGYYVRNLARPLWLARTANRVDALIGNPPWLSYRYMTKPMQASFREMSQDRGLWAGGTVATHQDLSGLFVARCVELYLKAGGQFAFVMPLAVLSQQQFAGFRTGYYPAPTEQVTVKFGTPWHLDRVQPHLFPVPSSVVFGERTVEETVAIPGGAQIWSGRLPSKDVSWEVAHPLLAIEDHQVMVAGTDHASSYHGRFTQGATVVPGVLLRVESAPAGPLGAGAGRRAVRSVRSRQEKRPWRDLPIMEGVVESEFVRPLLLGSTIVPYRCLPPLLAVVPWDGTRLLDGSDLRIDSYPGLAGWWRQAEQLWEAHRSSERMTRHCCVARSQPEVNRSPRAGVRSQGPVRRTRRQVERPAVRRSRDRRNPCGGSG